MIYRNIPGSRFHVLTVDLRRRSPSSCCGLGCSIPQRPLEQGLIGACICGARLHCTMYYHHKLCAANRGAMTTCPNYESSKAVVYAERCIRESFYTMKQTRTGLV